MISTAFLVLHVGAGALALASGLTLMVLPGKGNDRHRRIGRVFGWSMAVSLAASVVLALVNFSSFLLAIAGFSAYLLAAGWRAARRRKAEPGMADRLIAGLMLGLALVMIVAGLTGAVGGAANVVMPVFGMIGGALACQDLMEVSRVGPPRIARHLSRMMGALIGTITAALVVNGPTLGLPPIATWLVPTVLVVPAIIWWNVRLRRVAAGRG
ncbi:hypothetical protein P7L70_12245 [Tistrella mobilis]|uniref:hypothetical protein n=1 Tax=Tistrella mobilis TaxID=171437 RepID=UPI003558A7B1